MLIWILYDIEKDRQRTRVAKMCKQAGLYRVQFSCFLGTLNKNELDTLNLQIGELIDEEKDKVYIFPMSKNELQQCKLLGQAFDKNLVTDEIRAFFL
ncbi:CRISPR-associated endonuclease Cas2 [Marinilongibacter aquaticus]|uniref:CRISPR-associated endonuclease Cas2 n=1 Tax=Marinilongibacter aquaticus TaxID=2975157 RepID=UPI0021BDB84B|nr:CRISPR-associated endonuclease Cas2 [Marinilongibacter aquaticus]UBM60792.1 CRISPR-associated endonuclease Cas2 [Marinilongibacter aquaticus]